MDHDGGASALAKETAPSSRFTPAEIVVWGCWLAMSIAALIFVIDFGANIPFHDDYDLIWPMIGRPVSLQWLWSQHNEHRVPLPRLVLYSLYKATNFDFRAGMFFNVFALSALAFLLILAARIARGRASYADVFFPILLLHWGHYETILWSWQVALVIPTMLAAVLLAIMTLSPTGLAWRGAILAGICLVLLPLSGAAGLAFVPATGAWLFIAGVRAWRSEGTLGKIAGSGMVGSVAAALALTCIYFINFHRPSYHPSSPGLWSTLLVASEFLTMAFGLEGKALWHPAGHLVILLLGLSALVLIFSWVSRPAEAPRAQGLLLFLGGVCCLALGIGWGRAGFGDEAALESRYVTIAAPFLCCLYLTWAVQPGRAPQAACWLLSLCLCAALPFNMKHGFKAGQIWLSRNDRFLRDLRGGMDIMDLAKRYSQKGAMQVHGPALDFAIHLGMLCRAGIKPFGESNGPLYLGTVNEAEPISHGPFEQAFSVPQDGHCIHGWVGDLSRPDKPVTVSFYAGSDFLGTVLADQFGNEDFFRAFLGAGNHAFKFRFPPRLCDGKMHTVRVQIEHRRVQLYKL